LHEKPNKSRSYFQNNFLKFSRDFIERYQKYKLKKTIKHAYNNSPFYHKLFKENNLKPDDIKSHSDLIKIPYTTPENLQNELKSFFSVPEDQFVKVFTTSGTTGKPKKAYFTKNWKTKKSIFYKK